MKRTWLLTAAALIAGLALGVLYSWVISPLRYVDTTPATLRNDFKDAYRSAIAASYAATHNLERARARLSLLGDADPVDALSAQAQRMLAAGAPFQSVQSVAQLASDLHTGVAAALPLASETAAPTVKATFPAATRVAAAATPTTQPAGTEAEPTATLPAPTQAIVQPTARPTRTAVPTPSVPFELVSQDEVCNANLTEGLLQVSVLDSRRHQMPGVKISIAWTGGEESFFTGLKPEIADGYADYIMQPAIIYSVRVEDAGAPVTGLAAPSCPDSSGQTYLGGLKLVFQQP